MCGIAGMISFGGQVNPSEMAVSVKRMTGLMARRGPDDEGFWSDGKNCALGFRRLSILDLSSAAHQPMVSFDERYALVYNGEIYNFKEIRKELQGKGIAFRSSGDTEVVLQSLAYWGREALLRFNGMFALAFYDRKEKKILIARDHAGIKPLYYLSHSEGVVFASQYDQILSHQWARKQGISQDALGLYFRLGYIPAPYGFLKNTHMVEPGSWLEVSVSGSISKGTFFEFPAQGTFELKGEKAFDAVADALSQAVSAQLVSDVPVGAFLSGGIDSPLVAAEMKKKLGKTFPAFTIGVPGYEDDESADAIRYAQELGLQHHLEAASEDSVLSMLDDVVSASTEPFADFSIFPTLMVSKLARRQVKVMLSGDGGDELFWGYAGRFSSVLKKSRDFSKNFWLRSSIWWLKKFLNIGGGYYNLRYHSIGEWYRDKHTRVPNAYLHSIFPKMPSWPSDFKLFDFQGTQTDQTAQWLRWNEFKCHLPMVLLKVDRASMFHSLEVRVPMLDKKMIEVAARIDWKSCLDIEMKTGKIPLRAALKQHTSIQTQKKMGFSVPMGKWLRGPLKASFEKNVLDRSELCGFEINRHSMRKMFEEHLSGKQDFSNGLWLFLSLALWEDKHYKPLYE